MASIIARNKIITNHVTLRAKFTDIEFEQVPGITPWTVPITGWYRLEVWGAGGGRSQSQTGNPIGGSGGYSCGYKYLTEGQILYIAIGGKGETCPGPAEQDDGDGGIEYIGQEIDGGFNGGGGARSYKNGPEINGWSHQGGTGGGATHIATTNRGELKNYENYKSEIIIVAGGGGGGLIILDKNEGWITQGGPGGGLEGGIPTLEMYDPGTDDEGWSDPDAEWDLEGDKYKSTQTSGWKFGEGYSNYSGGGGGWYGGTCVNKGCFGGSGYIGGCSTSIILNGSELKSFTQIGGNPVTYDTNPDGIDGKCKITYLTSSL